MRTYGKYTANESGLVMSHEKGESVQDYRDLANAMSMGARSNYPVGLSPCFTAGINGDWEDDGYCPISKIDPSECTCEDEFKAPQPKQEGDTTVSIDYDDLVHSQHGHGYGDIDPVYPDKQQPYVRAGIDCVIHNYLNGWKCINCGVEISKRKSSNGELGGKVVSNQPTNDEVVSFEEEAHRLLDGLVMVHIDGPGIAEKLTAAANRQAWELVVEELQRLLDQNMEIVDPLEHGEPGWVVRKIEIDARIAHYEKMIGGKE